MNDNNRADEMQGPGLNQDGVIYKCAGCQRRIMSALAEYTEEQGVQK